MNLKEKLRRVYRMVWREEVEGKYNYSQKILKGKNGDKAKPYLMQFFLKYCYCKVLPSLPNVGICLLDI